MSAVGGGDGNEESTMMDTTSQPVISGFGLSATILNMGLQDQKRKCHQGYRDYLHGIVLSNILEEDLDIWQNAHRHEQLNKLADDILVHGTMRNHRMMNQEIQLQFADLNRSEALLKNLDDILSRITELPGGSRSKLARIAYELARQVEVIPVENGVANLRDKLETNTFSQFTQDPKSMNAIQGINYLIQKLHGSIETLDAAQSQLIKSSNGLEEMNRIVLKMVSHKLANAMVKNKQAKEAKEDTKHE